MREMEFTIEDTEALKPGMEVGALISNRQSG